VAEPIIPGDKPAEPETPEIPDDKPKVQS